MSSGKLFGRYSLSGSGDLRVKNFFPSVHLDDSDCRQSLLSDLQPLVCLLTHFHFHRSHQHPKIHWKCSSAKTRLDVFTYPAPASPAERTRHLPKKLLQFACRGWQKWPTSWSLRSRCRFRNRRKLRNSPRLWWSEWRSSLWWSLPSGRDSAWALFCTWRSRKLLALWSRILPTKGSSCACTDVRTSWTRSRPPHRNKRLVWSSRSDRAWSTRRVCPKHTAESICKKCLTLLVLIVILGLTCYTCWSRVAWSRVRGTKGRNILTSIEPLTDFFDSSFACPILLPTRRPVSSIGSRVTPRTSRSLLDLFCSLSWTVWLRNWKQED